MTQQWPIFRLKEICDISSSRRIRAHEYTESGVPFYRGKEIIEKHNGALRVSTDLFISEERFSEVCAKNGAPSAGDLLLTSVGTLGIPYVVQSGERFYFKDGNLTWFRNFDELISDYLYYWLLSPSGKAELKRCTIGSSQPAFTIVLLKDIEIALPPLPVQQRIASLLFNYDDLIENNTRRIEILEEMARRLYEEWFVHFRFPGNEEVSFKASELGEIPKGWEVIQLGNLVDEVKGAIPPSRVAPDTPYVGLEHIPRKSITLKEWSTADTVESSKLPFKKGDILFGKIRPYFHKVSVAPVDGICSSDTILLRVKQNEYFGLALCCSSSNEFIAHATQTANGTKMPRANWKVLSQYPLVLPNEELLKKFNNFVFDLVSQCQTLIFKNTNLRAQRDLLLPKLVSGEIDVSDIPMPNDKEAEVA